MKAALIGKLGEFTDSQGRVCQCIVRRLDDPPWDEMCMIVDYIHPDGTKVEGAFIAISSFRPTEQPTD